MNYNQSLDRIRDMIKRDKGQLDGELINLMKSDIYSVLSSYLGIDSPSLNMSYYVGDDNMYHFSLDFTARSIKHITFLS